jgi:hypothetical protein
MFMVSVATLVGRISSRLGDFPHNAVDVDDDG